MKKFEEIIEEGISCLIPIYEPLMGNSTKIITENGEIYVDKRTIKSVLRALCQYYTIQIEYCRKKYGKMIHQRLGVPILINSKLLLIPLKMRKPMFEKDGAYGYVNIHSLRDITEGDQSTLLHLNNGLEVKCLQRIRTVRQHLNRARIIMGSAYYENSDMPGDVRDFYEQYNLPATRGDIASLQKEILELTRILRGVVEQKKNTS